MVTTFFAVPPKIKQQKGDVSHPCFTGAARALPQPPGPANSGHLFQAEQHPLNPYTGD